MSHPRTIVLAVLPLIAVAAVGCRTVRSNVAVTEEYLHAQRPTFVDRDREKAVEFKTQGKHVVRAVCMQNRFGYPKNDKPDDHPQRHDDECLYYSASLKSLPDEAYYDPAERDDVVAILTSIADTNCGTYLFRVFASKSGIDTARNIFRDLSTGAAAGTAPFLPSVASGLGVTNLLLGTTVDNINSTYYFEKTFQAMESAITEERLKLRKAMIEKRTKGIREYPFTDALDDVREYGDACSIQRGLARLVEISGEKKNDAAKDLKRIVDPEHSTEAQIAKLSETIATLKETNLEAVIKAKEEELARIRKENEQLRRQAPAAADQTVRTNGTVPNLQTAATNH